MKTIRKNKEKKKNKRRKKTKRRIGEAAVRKEDKEQRNERGIRRENLLNKDSTSSKNILKKSQKIAGFFLAE